MAPQAQVRCRVSRAGALLLAITCLAATAACSHRQPRIRRAVEESEVVDLPACPTPVPPMPKEAAREGRYGVVLVGYTIEPDGRVDEIELEDPRASPLLFSAAKDWLQQCRSSPQGPSTPRRMSELLSFPPPNIPPVDETPLALNELSGMTRPQRDANCTPDKPPAAVSGHGTLTVEYVVHSNGRVGQTVLRGGDAPKALFKAVRAWLRSCPYMPALRDGRPVPAQVVESFTF